MAGPGRPRMGDEPRKIPMRRDQIDDLRAIAALEGVTQAAVIRRAIDREIKRVLRPRTGAV